MGYIWGNLETKIDGNYPRGGGGGGGVLSFFSSYVGSGPASTLHTPPPPTKYQEFQAPPKNTWNFSNPKKYPPFCTLILRKYPKMNRNDIKYSPV